MSQKPGLASAVDASKSGVTTLASRFESSETSDTKPSSRISDLASRFSQQSTISKPSLPTPSKPLPKKTISTPPTKVSPPLPPPENLSKKVSDLTKAFSNNTQQSNTAFSQAQSAFSNTGSESKVSAVARKLDSTDGPSDKVSGVARTFESMDTGNAAFVPRMEKKEVKKETVEDKIDGFHAVASRFEHGKAGEKDEREENDGKARERFLDAAKRFGG